MVVSMLLVSWENLEGVNPLFFSFSFFLEKSNSRFFCLPTWLWPPLSAVSLVYLLLRLSRPVPCITETGPVCSTGFDRCRVIQSHAIQLESFPPLCCDLSFRLLCWDAHMKCSCSWMWFCNVSLQLWQLQETLAGERRGSLEKVAARGD